MAEDQIDCGMYSVSTVVCLAILLPDVFAVCSLEVVFLCILGLRLGVLLISSCFFAFHLPVNELVSHK